MQSRIRFLWIVTGAVGLSAAQAESPPRDATRGNELSVRWASTTPVAGYEKVAFGGSTLYASPQAVVTGREIVSAERAGSQVNVALTAEAVGRIGRNSGGNQIAVFIDGQPASLGTLQLQGNGRASVVGLSDLAATRVLASVKQGRGPHPVEPPIAAPVITLAPSGRSGDLYFVDAFVQGAGDLRTYQVALSASGGSIGELVLDEVQIDAQREDYVFHLLDAISAEDQIGGRAAGLLREGSVDVAAPAYLGTFVFRAGRDTEGTFDIHVDLTEKTFLADSANEKVAAITAAALELTINRVRNRDTGK